MEELRRVIVDAASFSHFRTLARIFFVIFAVFVLLGFVHNTGIRLSAPPSFDSSF